ncbi:formylglycine-generating enzyme family protein [Anabaena sp. UHCC 0253]|uniref:formylglycine-generating enzyme family protein n=1 Tax=Anabaena sp. UHCC 0253 TaxID=2590019 RepID=UPI0014471202|nr:formylglycine-generating enzyme family protein [Anabaena sp. UHCC 0253]MTJ54155.1 formylglycine-generating enzyme family protein [Anabaena sp. UHCC 0253]
MTDEPENKQELQEQAKQAVERFVWRFGEPHLLLAYHAALPLVLTPELVNYLRNQFLRGEQVPWVAEVDLLLSDLCSQVGYELYAMDTHVRAYLLAGMREKYPKNMQQVAQVLISYVSYLSRLNPGRRQQELEAQRWAAMVYLGEEECKKAANEIIQKFLETRSGLNNQVVDNSGVKAELARLVRLTDELSPQLAQETDLLNYAKLVQQSLRNPQLVSAEVLSSAEQILAQTIKPPNIPQIIGFPEIKILEFEFEFATITIEGEDDTTIKLQPFDFEVAQIEINQTPKQSINPLIALDEVVFNQTGNHLDEIQRRILEGTLENLTYKDIASLNNDNEGTLKWTASKLWNVLTEVIGEKVTKTNFKNVINQWVARSQIIINTHSGQAQQFIEDLGNGIKLEMVAIPGGTFIMGSPENEDKSSSRERPQHEVTIKPFAMGKYPITQAQWQVVAQLPQVNQELKLDPSRFKGANRPVERVSWHNAVEFCARLSNYTQRPYRLPSEAEWEYACRGGTKTPFHFGETITTDLANYNGNYTYGNGVQGIYREETTEVGYFKVANEFGLYDMHGNVREWCQDGWHDNYKNAPIDGTAWSSQSSDRRMLRGGSWFNDPVLCRSGYRHYNSAGFDNDNVGFRVVCGAAWTL